MHKNTRAFTLVELLVAVLIIGVLTAIALPMYQKSVDKSRYATLMPLAKNIKDAQEAFYLGGGKYSKDLGSLDVRVPGNPSGNTATLSDGTTVEISNTDGTGYVKMGKENLNNYYVMYQDRSGSYPGEIHCEALTDNDRAQELCQNLGGTKIDQALTSGYTAYVLVGTGTSGATPSDPEEEEPTTPTCDPDAKPAIETSEGCSSGAIKSRTVTCDNGSWSAGAWSNCLTLYDGGTCNGTNYQECSNGMYINGGSCTGAMTMACMESTFINSSCTGNENGTCMSSTFTNSSCTGSGQSVCAYGTFINSSCSGSGPMTCSSEFHENSRCYATGLAVCNGASYDDTSCCVGTYCESGTTCAEKGLPDEP